MISFITAHKYCTYIHVYIYMYNAHLFVEITLPSISPPHYLLPCVQDGFNTPLTIATGLFKETAKRTVSLLLQAGALANGHPRSAVRPLVAAASRGHVDTMELLLSAGADVNLANKVRASVRVTPYELVHVGCDGLLHIQCTCTCKCIANVLGG